MPLADIFFSV